MLLIFQSGRTFWSLDSKTGITVKHGPAVLYDRLYNIDFYSRDIGRAWLVLQGSNF